MSGIYGFSFFDADVDRQVIKDTLGSLEYWNRIYGRQCHDCRDYGYAGIGCHVEHFSDRFPYGGPILEQDGKQAVLDALLFNREELINQLALEPDCVQSDEELLFKWINIKGFDSLSQVNGDFTGAIYDTVKGTWTLFRDHFGVRPLYYYLDEQCFAFSTDLRALAAMPLADSRIDEMQFFINVSGTNPLSIQRTDFECIRCIKPASVTYVRRTNSCFSLTEQIYWSPAKRKIRLKSDEEYQNMLRHLISDAVHRRCDAVSGLLGAEFSGGLDSSVIDVLINRHGREAKYFSWSRDLDSLAIVDDDDERNIIREICEREQIECHLMSKNDIVTLQECGERIVPPYVDTFLLGYGSAWLKSQGANVVFSGHGGDEGVSHRGIRFELFYCHEYLDYFNNYRKDFAGKPLAFLRAIRSGLKDAKADYHRINTGPSTSPRHLDVLLPDFARRMLSRFAPQLFTFNYSPLTFVMQGGTRPRMDNVAYQGAFHGVRYLFPYVDYRVMDFALSIPRSQFVGWNISRRVFREAFRDFLPDKLYHRGYKHQISTRQLSRCVQDQEELSKSIEKLLSQFDRHLWKDYFDFDMLRKMLLDNRGESGGIGSIDSLYGYLHRCIMIQNVQQNAKRWREFDEQDKTV